MIPISVIWDFSPDLTDKVSILRVFDSPVFLSVMVRVIPSTSFDLIPKTFAIFLRPSVVFPFHWSNVATALAPRHCEWMRATFLGLKSGNLLINSKYSAIALGSFDQFLTRSRACWESSIGSLGNSCVVSCTTSCVCFPMLFFSLL